MWSRWHRQRGSDPVRVNPWLLFVECVVFAYVLMAAMILLAMLGENQKVEVEYIPTTPTTSVAYET